tara:strand:+ start:1233 stop:2585 length:1353 start_codon:yes stop_codon:yes gene_type:complete
MISITKLSHNFELVDLVNDTQLSKDDLICLASGYQQLFKDNNLVKGDRIGLAMQEDSHHLAAVFAAMDFGLIIVISGEHEITDEYISRRNIKCMITRGNQPCTIHAKNVLHIELDTNRIIDNNINEYVIDHSEILVEALTSGSTGKPKCISHTHKSIESASNDSIKHYWQDASTSWFFHNIVHLGVSSVYFFPAIFNSKRMVIPSKPNEYDQELLNKYKPNIMLMFPNHFESYNKLPYADLSFVDYVLTGGSTIPYNFCKRLFRQGVKKVAVIYGLTECLPPIIHKIVTPENIQDYDESDMGYIIDHSGTYDINKDGILTITGSSHLCKDIDDVVVDEFITNDKVSATEKGFKFERRNTDLIRINDTLVNPNQIVPDYLKNYICLFSINQQYVVICMKKKDLHLLPVIQKLEKNGIEYDKLITDIELNVLGKPNINKLREIYDNKNKGTS